MDDPYLRHAANLENSATSILTIAPSDVADLPKVCKALRIYNPNNAAATIRITTKNGEIVTLTIPAAALWTEPCVTKKVHTTGTTAELIIHGYTD